MSILEKILKWGPVAFLIGISKRIVIPGFNGIPLYNVTVFFIRGIMEGYITSRAAAISFSLFLAIFPSILFFFTIIPFIPIENFQLSLLNLIRDFVPNAAYASVQETVEDIVTRHHGGLLSIGFILTLYFSTNGINSLIDAFNHTYHTIETRSMIRQYLISVLLVLIHSMLLIIAIGLITFGTSLLKMVVPEIIFGTRFFFHFLVFLKWIVIVAMLFFAISFIYYYAPAKKKQFRFISAGSSLATLLVIITTLGFNYYVDNFSKYNILYGSIGTLMVVMLWIYFNSISLLVGFELNASIHNAQQKGITK